ncbi:WD40 repeat-like protein [Coniophora puteana RWD-64-598 SS2]|uniref:Polyadenylation factor subunit 2 n=1 Tax=Coniophora puteana (strain RWD-64-598) TaxID=741705 RepID=A0A5M3N2F4_CONPW|nr:WD40 repeat-like protein [Coniophora puteana RWD-64-598 SS2]EIW85562.1 WD40 repeat-like protein [Coniophora puteana RWD-64-598 SS2]
MTSNVPLLLPPSALAPSTPKDCAEWVPTQHLSEPQPPPVDDVRIMEMELAAARQLADGKTVKKTRPRRTVDFNGTMGKWIKLRKTRPTSSYVPYIRPAPPYIIDLLPPSAYPNNVSTSICTKFVHTSTNKLRCPVNVVTWTPEARRILTGSTSGEFTLWNGLTFNFETILQAHDTAIRAMKFTNSGAFLASADQSGVIKYFQPNMNNLTAWNGHREAIRGLSFSPDDGRFATASDDSTIRIWSFEESREERVMTGHGWDVKCVEWHPTKGLLVSGSKDNLIKFWDPRTGTVLSTLHQHKNTIQALAWSPNGNLVASASRDQTVRVFDIRAMKEFRVLKGHKKEVCSVTWHPVHPVLVSGGSEGSILHWDLSQPEPSTIQPALPPRATLAQAHDSNVWTLAFHPLGHILASGSNDYTTRFWARERPGDASSVFAGGGEKPPEADAGGQDDEDDMMVPGFSFGAGAGGNGFGSAGPGGGGQGQGWWKQEDQGGNPLLGPSSDGYVHRASFAGDAMDSDDFIPGLGGGGGGGASGGGGGGGFGGGMDAGPSEPPPQSASYASQNDSYGRGGRQDDRDRGDRGDRGGGRFGASGWQNRRGRRGRY